MLILAFFINLLWELFHRALYKKFAKKKYKQKVQVLLKHSFMDAFSIVAFYSVTAIIYNEKNILSSKHQLLTFIFMVLLFSFFDEKVSVRHNRWSYTKKMPKFLGVGITPILELVVTGLIVFMFVF